ncbi:MFS transporter [Rhodovarius crocodyli]|uniref:MFS transporter n=1 Tax=Rhodovarius crocodyli TaxID=1979269 RepID=UPI0013E2B52D|nr:MFS transporter [Rhodovarius crocodyli]
MSAVTPVAAGWRPFLWVAAALVSGVMGTALASPLFPLYQRLWGLAPSTITLVFVAYMMGVLAAFLFLGRLPVHLGPVRQLRLALLLMLTGLLLSMLAGHVGVLILGRVCIGVASGLVTTAATLGLMELEPPRSRRFAPLVATAGSVFGFGCGPLLGGMIAQWGRTPLVTPYLAMLAALAVVLAGLHSFRARGGTKPGFPSLRPRFVLPQRAARPAFLVGGFATFAAFSLFSLYAALAPSFVNELLPWRGPAVSGTAIAAILFCSAGAQMALRGLGARGCALLGLALLAAAAALLAGTVLFASVILFAASVLVAGAGHGLCFLAGMTITEASAPAEERAGVLSCFFSIGYTGTVLPVLGVGLLADRLGLAAAVLAFCGLLGGGALLLLACAHRLVGRPRPATASSPPAASASAAPSRAA